MMVMFGRYDEGGVDMCQPAWVDPRGQAWGGGCNGRGDLREAAGSSLRYCRAGRIRACAPWPPPSGIPHRRCRWRRYAGSRRCALGRVPRLRPATGDLGSSGPMRGASSAKPDFYRVAVEAPFARAISSQGAWGSFFLKIPRSRPAPCAWWRGRAERFAVTHGAQLPAERLPWRS